MGHNLSQYDMSWIIQARPERDRPAGGKAREQERTRAEAGRPIRADSGCEEGGEEYPTRKAAATRVERAGPSGLREGSGLLGRCREPSEDSAGVLPLQGDAQALKKSFSFNAGVVPGPGS